MVRGMGRGGWRERVGCEWGVAVCTGGGWRGRRGKGVVVFEGRHCCVAVVGWRGEGEE